MKQNVNHNDDVMCGKNSHRKTALAVLGLTAVSVVNVALFAPSALAASNELIAFESEITTSTSSKWTASNKSNVKVVTDSVKGDVLQLSSTSPSGTSIMHHTASNTFPGLKTQLEASDPMLIFSGGSNLREVDPTGIMNLAIKVVSGNPQVNLKLKWEYTDSVVASGGEVESYTTDEVGLTCSISDDYTLNNSWKLIDWQDDGLLGACSNFTLDKDITAKGMYSFETRSFEAGVKYSTILWEPGAIDFSFSGVPSLITGIGFSVTGTGVVQFADIDVRDFNLKFAKDPVLSLTLNPGDSIVDAVEDIADGGVITLNAGIYELSGFAVTDKSVTVKGQGDVVLQQSSALGSGKFIDIRSTSDVRLENLTLRGNDNLARRTTAIDINSASDIVLKDVRIEGFTKNGVAVTSQWRAGYEPVSNNISFENVSVDGAAWAGIAFYPVGTGGTNEAIKNVTFQGVTTVKDTAYGIQFADDVTDAKITGVSDGPVALGEVVFAGNGVNISNNNATAITLDGASTIDGKSVTSSDFVGSNVTILGEVVTPGEPPVDNSNPPSTTPGLGTGARVPSAPSAPSGSEVTAGPAAPAAAPVQDSSQLADFLSANGVDPQQSAASFVASGNNPLDSFDPSQPLNGDLPWAGGDNFVDVYAYSAPIFIGTYPVVNGQLQLRDVDLSALGDGDHHLVLLGQESGVVDALALTVVTPEEPVEVAPPAPTTPEEVAPPAPTTPEEVAPIGEGGSSALIIWGVVAVLVILVAITAVVVVRKKKQA